MDPTLPLDIRRQPDDTTCGPTCLHAIYNYYGDPISLDEVIAQVPQWRQGGTLAVYLAIHALRRGYRATIIPFNLTVFDPTWAQLGSDQIAGKLRDQLNYKREWPNFEEVTRAYLEYLALGGKLQFEVLRPALIRRFLKRGTPVLTGLSATYLYNVIREYDADNRTVADDVRGRSAGHFVVLWGYRREDRHVLVADPLVPNPLAPDRYYDVDIYRLVCAIMLGILTYDGNLLIIRRPKKFHRHLEKSATRYT
jgi:hypothetical protein